MMKSASASAASPRTVGRLSAENSSLGTFGAKIANLIPLPPHSQGLLGFSGSSPGF